MKDIRTFSSEEIKEYIDSIKEKKFRAKQIYEWLWQKGVTSFDAMTNLPKILIEKLISDYNIYPAKVFETKKSKDGTIKIAFQLSDSEYVEGVLIPSGSRMTACISSQVGCALNCAFCATAKIKFRRNLSPGEIFDQVVAIDKLAQEHHNQKLSNIVLMGMGEPLLNYDNVLSAIDKINGDNGLGMSPLRITLSTAGISKKIIQLANDNVKFNLAVSLHSAINERRSKLMPYNEKDNLVDLRKAIAYFSTKTGSRITMEYLLIDNVNDTIDDAKSLAEFCKAFPCKINLIEFNDTGSAKFRKTSDFKTNRFKSFIESKNMIVNIRQSKGEDIDAACGQLANKIMKNGKT